jgi:nitroreductase
MTETRSMRRIKPDPVPIELIREVIGYATHAPTGSNNQGWRFIVVTEAETRRAIGELYRKAVDYYLAEMNTQPMAHQTQDEWERIMRSVRWQGDHLAQIPVLIFAALDQRAMPVNQPNPEMLHRVTGGQIYPAVQNLLLACRAKGLGATLTTLHLLHEGEARKILNLPDGVNTFCMIPIGYPMGRFGPTRRLPVEDKIVWERWPD